MYAKQQLYSKVPHASHTASQWVHGMGTSATCCALSCITQRISLRSVSDCSSQVAACLEALWQQLLRMIGCILALQPSTTQHRHHCCSLQLQVRRMSETRCDHGLPSGQLPSLLPQVLCSGGRLHLLPQPVPHSLQGPRSYVQHRPTSCRVCYLSTFVSQLGCVLVFVVVVVS